ncbi:MAG: RluA family pseudouridine synthase [Paracoccaceae bacterium]
MAVLSEYMPPKDPLSVLYEDGSIIVVDKPAGLLSVPGRGPHLADCLISRIADAYPNVLLVHRLDRDTSGVMVFALTRDAQKALGQQFERKQTQKTYVARVSGQLKADSGTVDLPVIVDWPNRPKHMVCHETGKPALTEWRVVNRSAGETRVLLTPKTGRTHQLRLHMMALKHPILGDPFYASGADADYDRMMLHSETLSLTHPSTGEPIKFHASAPF